MNVKGIRKLTVSAMLVATAIALSPFSIPVGTAKCFPAQHMINVLSAVLLGPYYGVAIAFASSFLRNIMGTGTLLAFPGSMAGALLAGIVYSRTGNLIAGALAEVFGTGIIGGIFAFFVAVLFMGREAALFAFVVPFLVSTAGGSLIAVILIESLARTGALERLRGELNA